MARTDPSIIEEEDQVVSPSPEQREPLLSTKFIIPALRPDRISRPRLLRWMNSGLDKALGLVSAPAGYGKTTLVSSWLHEIDIPSTWISLDESDNDPIRFLQYLLTALQKVLPSLQMDVLDVLRGKAGPVTLLNILLNEIAGLAGRFVLVLDDFHLIHNELVLNTIAYLIEHEPIQMHLVLISRTDPPLPLSHLRARGQLADTRAEHLRFTRDEISFFFNEGAGLDLSSEDISAMDTRTEGWIAGLQLAAISMQGMEDAHSFVTAFTGSHHYIMDYLTEEVLRRQPEQVGLFLLQTSILGRMCASLCEAVVDPEALEGTNAQAALEDLERMNLFLIPLDHERRWYRYHHLFAEVLSRRLEHSDPARPAVLNQRAAQWYERNHWIPEAIQHSLAAGNHQGAIQLIEKNGVLLLIRGEVTTLLKWIEAVEPYAKANPWLYIFRAWAYALTGNLEEVNGMLRAAEGLIASMELVPDVMIMKGTIAAGQAYQANVQGDTPRAVEFARQALEYLPDNDLISRSLRAVSTSLLGDASSMTGELEEARQAYLESARISQAAGDIHLVIVVNSNLANVLVEQGRLRQAARIYADTLQLATRPDGQKAVIAGRVFAELSQVYYEWNQLGEAEECIQHSLSMCRRWGNMDLQAVGYVMLARLAHVQHHPEEALEAMQAAEQIVKNYDLAPLHAMWVKSNLARLWILLGNLERAHDFIQRCGIDTALYFAHGAPQAGKIPYLYEPGIVVFLRLLLAQGETETALALSQGLLRTAETAQRTGRMIELFIIQALAYQRKNETQPALEALECALTLAEPEGYTRVFLDEGAWMAKMLFLVKARRVGRGYESVLLAALDGATGKEAAPAQLLIEPLTGREIEVLKLIESGCTNQDIASSLFVSMATVKRHISNIYAKLGAKSRTQAVSLGKELKLFE